MPPTNCFKKLPLCRPPNCPETASVNLRPPPPRPSDFSFWVTAWEKSSSSPPLKCASVLRHIKLIIPVKICPAHLQIYFCRPSRCPSRPTRQIQWADPPGRRPSAGHRNNIFSSAGICLYIFAKVTSARPTAQYHTYRPA